MIQDPLNVEVNDSNMFRIFLEWYNFFFFLYIMLSIV